MKTYQRWRFSLNRTQNHSKHHHLEHKHAPLSTTKRTKQLIFGSALRNNVVECVNLSCQKPKLTSQFDLHDVYPGFNCLVLFHSRCCVSSMFNLIVDGVGSHNRRWRHLLSRCFFRPGVWFAKPSDTINLRQNTIILKQSGFFRRGSPKWLGKRDLWQKYGFSVIWV